MTRLIVADDHPLMLEGVVALFAGTEFEVAARCLDGEQAREAILELKPDIAILDLRMPRISGLDLLREARAAGWATRIVLLTAEIQPEPILEAVRAKVDGVVLKGSGAELLLTCVRRVSAGERWIDRDAMSDVLAKLADDEPAETGASALTARETDVARLVAQGRRNKEIARELGISEGTVKMHLHNLYEKLSVTSRTELALLARDRAWF
jgi:DNA-binding NarL/FixJ family response regulator